MTVETTSVRRSYSGDGASVAFATVFQFLDAVDLLVISKSIATGVETQKTLNTHYTVSGGNGDTGTVTFLVAPTADEVLTLINDPVITQGLDLVEGDVSPAEAKERAWDKLTMICQRLKDRIGRVLQLTEGASAFNPVLPSVLVGGGILSVKPDGSGFDLGPALASRASMFAAWDALGNLISAAGMASVPVTAFAATLLDDVDAATMRNTLELGVLKFALVNNQSAPADITGLLLDKTKYRCYVLDFDIRIRTDSLTELRQLRHKTYMYYADTDTWQQNDLEFEGDALNLNLTLNGQQVQYTTANEAGANYSGSVRVSMARRFDV